MDREPLCVRAGRRGVGSRALSSGQLELLPALPGVSCGCIYIARVAVERAPWQRCYTEECMRPCIGMPWWSSRSLVRLRFLPLAYWRALRAAAILVARGSQTGSLTGYLLVLLGIFTVVRNFSAH